MIYQKVNLKEEYGLQGGELQCICIDKPFDAPLVWKRPAVIVVPGGGYGMTSLREAEVIAMPFMARGFQVFVLHYLTAKEGVHYPEELLELAASFDYVRKHANEFSINPSEVFAVGFSAGGHLVADLSCEYMLIEEKYGKPLDCKPTAVGLSYPVIYYNGHQGSFINLTQGMSDEERERILPTLDLDKRVTKDTPPTFIWSTFEDKTVPCENTLRYASALNAAGVRFALHIYPFGAHGLASSDYEVSEAYGDAAIAHSRRWIDDCASFFRIYVEEKF